MTSLYDLLIKRAAELKPLPSTPQKDEFSCGAAAVQSVAQYFGHWTRQEDVAKSLGTSEAQGTHPNRMVEFLNKLKLKATMVTDMSWEALQHLNQDRNCAVILDFQAWQKPKPTDYSNVWDSGHYATLVGLDDTTIYLRDPSIIGSLGVLSKEDFLSRWHDYETKDGKRIEHHRMAIIVYGQEDTPDPYTPIE